MALSNPVAIVTGGARRIGRAIVEDLAANGWAVAIHCNASCEDGDQIAADIVRGGGKATVIGADLSNLAEAVKIVPFAAKALGAPTLRRATLGSRARRPRA